MKIANGLTSFIKSVGSGTLSSARSAYAYFRFEASQLRKRAKKQMRMVDILDDGFANQPERDAFEARIARVPENQCIYAIGDIHGRFDLLLELLQKIQLDIESLPEGTVAKFVFLGDYIDRGLNSKEVIDYFLSGALQDFETVYLMGNHESALLRFTEDASFGETWASYGGVETLYSYGFQVPSLMPPGNAGFEDGYKEAWTQLWMRFRSEIPEAHMSFYRNLSPYHVIGDYIFVHAGLRPGVPIEQQSLEDLYWIRDEFLSDHRQFEKMVVHGHTPADKTFHDHRRIGLDTGAYITGCLSAGRFFNDDVQFIST